MLLIKKLPTPMPTLSSQGNHPGEGGGAAQCFEYQRVGRLRTHLVQGQRGWEEVGLSPEQNLDRV